MRRRGPDCADHANKQAGAPMSSAQKVLKRSEALEARVDKFLTQIRAP